MDNKDALNDDNVIAFPRPDQFANFGPPQYMLEYAHSLYASYVKYCDTGDKDNANQCISDLELFRLVSGFRNGVSEYESVAISCLYTWAWYERIVTAPNPELRSYEIARKGLRDEIIDVKAIDISKDDPYYRITRLNYEIAKLLLYKTSGTEISFGKRLFPYRYQLEKAVEIIGADHQVIVRAKRLAKTALTA